MLQPFINSAKSEDPTAGMAMHSSLQFAIFPAEYCRVLRLEPLLQTHVQSAVCRVGNNWAPEERITKVRGVSPEFQEMWRDTFRTLRNDSAQLESQVGYMAAHVTFRPPFRQRIWLLNSMAW